MADTTTSAIIERKAGQVPLLMWIVSLAFLVCLAPSLPGQVISG